jgi:hypothetical protein
LSSLYAPGKTSRSVIHPEIAPGQARLTLEFFADGLPEKKLQLDGISMLLILLSRGECYNNKKERLRWCISMLDQITLPNSLKFSEMDNIIHIDEKWFNTTKKNRNFYMLPEDEDPHRTVQNKNAIDILMFLGAIEKTKTDDEGNIIFNENRHLAFC